MKRRLKSAAFSIVILAAVLAATVFGGVHSNGILPASALPSSVGFYAVSYLNIENGDGAASLNSAHTRNAAAYHERTFRDGRFGSRKRCIKVDLCNSCFSEYDRLFGSCRHILMHP